MGAMSESAIPAIPFPPQEIGDFLRFCAGEWMGLRSQFALAAVSAAAELDTEDGDAWHSSERGELVVVSRNSPTTYYLDKNGVLKSQKPSDHQILFWFVFQINRQLKKAMCKRKFLMH